MRDRLAELQKEAAVEPEVPEDVNTDDVAIEMEMEDPKLVESNQEMTKFFRKVKGIRDSMVVMEEKIQDVQRKHSELLVEVKKDEIKRKNDQLHELMHECSRMGASIQKNLKVMEKENAALEENAKPDEQFSADMRIRKGQYSTLLRKFSQIMEKYNRVQAENQKKYRDKLRREIQIVDPNLPEETINQIIEHGTEGIFTGKKLEEAEKQLNEIQDRHNDLLALERSLQELHEMFLDMAILVESQGEMIDRIEFAVEKSHDYVGEALVSTRKAERLQSAARHKQWCLFLCFLILIALIVGIAMGVGG